MTGTLVSVVMLPPTSPMTVFFSDRLLASKIGKSTQASFASMRTTGWPLLGGHTQYATLDR